MKYKNYIFDLYGTLIDIHTDEENPELWEFMSGYLCNTFNAVISGSDLRREYLRLCAYYEKKLSEENKSKYPEIRIEWVWEGIVGRKCTEDEMSS